MAVQPGVILEKATEEKDIALKRRQRSPSAESPNPPSSFETPRASSASTPRSSVPSSVRSTPAREKPSKYVSKMAKAREEKKRKEEAAAAAAATAAAAPNNINSEKSTMSSDLETSSSIPSTESGTLSEKSQANGDKLGILPKFGEWNKHSANSGPCYTLLFQNAAQEKKVGGPIRVHRAKTADGSVPNQDLYGYHKPAPVKIPKKLKKSGGGLLCCFKTSES